MNFSCIKLITFDVTGTILQFKHPIGKLYCDIGALFKVKCDEEQMMKNFKREWKNMVHLHPNFGQGDIGWRNWWTILVCNSFKDFNADEQKGKQIANYLVDKFKTMEYWNVSDGALKILSYLTEKQMCLGVISNFDERLETILLNAKLRHYFQFVICSYEAGIQKPDINIFKLAMCKSQLNNVQPNQCLHIGDNFKLDFMSAKSAGWNAMLINNTNQASNNMKDIATTEDEIFKNFNEVAKILGNKL